MVLKQGSMKWLRALHILSVSIWFGGVVCIGWLAFCCFFLLPEAEFLTVASLIPKLYKTIVLPFALLAIIQGLIYGFLTDWGFVKHKWVLVKWVLVFLIVLCTGPGVIGKMFNVLDKVEKSGFTGGFADGGLVLFFIALQILFLAVMVIISVFKPMKRRK